MSRIMTGCLVLCVLGVFGLLLSGGATRAQEPDPRLDKVFADWKKRQERARAVRYRVSGKATLPKGSLSLADTERRFPKETPPRDIVTPLRRTMLLDFTTNRHRLETVGLEYHADTDKVYPRVVTRLFDGTAIKAWRPRELNTHPITGVRPTEPEIGVGKGHIGAGAGFEMSLLPFFVGHGTVMWRGGPVIPGKLKGQPDRDLVYVHGAAVHQGRPCLVLRTQAVRRLSTSFDEFWVDPARESAIVRQFWMADKVAYVDFDIEYQATADGWLPLRWVCTQRDPGSGKTAWIEQLRVEEVRLDPPVSDADFDIEEQPGMLVDHATYAPPKAGTWWDAPEPERTLYRIDEGGQRHEVLIEDGVERRRGSRSWWLATALIPLVALSVWLLYRRKKSRGRSVVV